MKYYFCLRMAKSNLSRKNEKINFVTWLFVTWLFMSRDFLSHDFLSRDFLKSHMTFCHMTFFVTWLFCHVTFLKVNWGPLRAFGALTTSSRPYGTRKMPQRASEPWEGLLEPFGPLRDPRGPSRIFQERTHTARV